MVLIETVFPQDAVCDGHTIAIGVVPTSKSHHPSDHGKTRLPCLYVCSMGFLCPPLSGVLKRSGSANTELVAIQSHAGCRWDGSVASE